MLTLNLGIVAHVDAGKTSLTERLLYEAGVLDIPGSVDSGTTRTDSMALERLRGITIRSAVATFTIRDVGVNVIDTPGHSDFIAEVERSLAVLDGAVLVVSGVEGVQAQTVVLHRALRRLAIPTIVFVNKADRPGTRLDVVLSDIRRRLVPLAIAVQGVFEVGTPRVWVRPRRLDDPGFAGDLLDAVAEQDDAILDLATSGDMRVSPRRLARRFAALARAGRATPVMFGSAITGAGVAGLRDLLTRYLPVTRSDPGGAPSGQVFKIERGPASEKLVYLRLHTGAVRVRDRIDLGHGASQRVTAINVFGERGAVPSDVLRAGQIARLRGLDSARVGDLLGDVPATRRPSAQFARPSLETVVTAIDPARRIALFQGLRELAESDPLIDVRRDDARGEITVCMYGEVQKQVLASLLEAEHGVQVEFSRSTPLCIERLAGTGAHVEAIGMRSNPFLATVGLRVEPAVVGSGVSFGWSAERGSMPPAFFTAVEESMRAALEQGPHGWPIPDAAVTLTHTGYWGRHSIGHADFTKSISSTAADFRYLTPLVLMTALLEAGTQVCEPIHRFVLELPAQRQQAVLAVLPGHRAIPLTTRPDGDDRVVIEGVIPADRVHDLRQRVPDLTAGEGTLTTEFAEYRPVRGDVPERLRTDDDPRDPDGYLRRTARIVDRAWPPV